MRRLQAYTADAPQPKPDDLAFHCDIDLRALTPIYKGSANPDGIDPLYPFRGPALRGQLRAWWRAVHPTSHLRTLRDDEKRLFGGVFGDGKGSPRASRVRLGVYAMHSTPATRHQLGRHYCYALWVDGNNDREPRYHLDARGRLRIEVPEDDEVTDEDVARLRTAVRALVLLGGSGSRTRRGMGRLWSTELLGEHIAGPDQLAERLAALAPPAADRAWPSLSGIAVAWKTGNAYDNAGQAVGAALDDFKDLRGMRALGGRRFDGSHREPEAQQDWLDVKAGRVPARATVAALGMPLTYRSSNGHLRGPVTLNPVGRKRLPSPIHVRPVPLPGGKFAAVILALRPWYRGAIEAKAIRQRGGLNPDAVQVVLRGLRKRGWTLVSTEAT